MGGEKHAGRRRIGGQAGSPPRGRGKDCPLEYVYLSDRITPAWAGKRRQGYAVCLCVEDHPRVGGDKVWCRTIYIGCQGSPPRGRGKGKGAPRADYVLGITPAWAGKRRDRGASRSLYQDHPRVGGEKIAPNKEIAREWGSPPRGRGKVDSAAKSDAFDRITPAWAGKSRIKLTDYGFE